MSFERKLHLGINSKERHFSTKTQFVRTTDEFWKNVKRSNDLPQNKLTHYLHFVIELVYSKSNYIFLYTWLAIKLWTKGVVEYVNHLVIFWLKLSFTLTSIGPSDLNNWKQIQINKIELGSVRYKSC
jgi:hypothetical protein